MNQKEDDTTPDTEYLVQSQAEDDEHGTHWSNDYECITMKEAKARLKRIPPGVPCRIVKCTYTIVEERATDELE